MAGTLPGEAILHLRQLTLFLQVCHLPYSPLHAHGKNVLLCAPESAKSWFFDVRKLCQTYSLDHPLFLLSNPPRKAAYKEFVDKMVVSYWEASLREEAATLPSLHLFAANNCSIGAIHPVFSLAGKKDYEVTKATIVARMISGRYRTDYLARHWSNDRSGRCSLCRQENGTLDHIIVRCSILNSVRDKMKQMALAKSAPLVPLYEAYRSLFTNHQDYLLQFLLEPSLFPSIAELWVCYGENVRKVVYYVNRTFLYSIHCERLKILGEW